ncbi:hypothetical protein [Amycolatopsis speibonae]|uniref:Uncharacterized protein n=1 Tax=Amycolatopsis speibonae TaxID=1450224 RepID=A0ABV7P7U9_9PSEU
MSTINVPVPTGAAAGHVAVQGIERWESTNPAITWASGFTQIVSLVSGSSKLNIAWKRLTAADTGNYTSSWTGSQWSLGHCILISGALSSGDPIEASNTATSASGTSVPTTSVTTATLAFLTHFVSNENSATTTPPTSFTEVQDSNYLHTNYWIPGSTGSLSASGSTLSASTLSLAALIAVKPDTGGAAPSVPIYTISSYGSFH